MLVNFGIKNFKTFKEKTILSFEKGKKRELNHHIIHTNNYELLPIKVIYGGNACGKSNLLEALYILKMFILKKGVRFQRDDYIDLCTNFDNYEKPIEFSITFINDNKEYYYFLSIVNYFKEKESKILKEILKENKKIIFERTNNKIKFSSEEKVIEEHYKILLDDNSKNIIVKMIEENIKSTDTFTSWYSTVDNKLCEKIITYFSNITTIIDPEQFNINSFIKINDKNMLYQDKNINNLLKELNVGKEQVIFKYSEDGKINNFVSYKNNDDINIIAPINSIESKGTIKLIDLLYPFITTLKYGSPIFIDELDASIHHEIIYNIIQTFGDSEINKNGAQLIFTTHNPVYLNKDLLRRDEIVFIEKDNNGSHLHTLDDYNIRNDQVYLKNYLNGNYTVLPNFDFSNLIK